VQLEFATDHLARLSSQSAEALLNPQSPQWIYDNEEIQIQIIQQGEVEHSVEELSEEKELRLRVRPRLLGEILILFQQKPAY
jgi:hypothetical protein